MEDNLSFYLPPTSAGLPDLSTPPDSIRLERAGGQTLALDPRTIRVTLTEERPPVERMEGDLGAICEVYKTNRYFYAAASGVSLAVGDVLSLAYHDRTIRLIVIDLENGRARIDPPITITHSD